MINSTKDLQIYSIIEKPVLTSKSYKFLEDSNKYVFFVNRNSTKHNIRDAIKKVFDVDAEKINIINVKGKKKTRMGIVGKRSNKKKAIVSLLQGQKIAEIKKD